MDSSPDELVRTFVALLSDKNIEAAAALVSDDFEYDNVPIGKTFGPQGLRDTLTGFFAMCEEIDWEILQQTSSGDLTEGVVLNERDDRLKIHGHWRTLPVAGVFLIRNGQLTLWRDYFDRTTLTDALSPPETMAPPKT